MARILILKNAQVYNPDKQGLKDVLCIEGKIAKIDRPGKIDEKHFNFLGLKYELINVDGNLLIPGLIDPHQHFLGGSGEKGFSTRTPEINILEQIRGGITTIVGCIGVDTITRTMQGLLAQAKSYNEDGLSAYIWSGGYPIPPCTLTGSTSSDMMIVPEVIGTGELAISDLRGSQPTNNELAKIIADGYIGGLMSRKCGVTHFHMGDGKRHLEQLAQVLKDFDVSPDSIYPTHVNRNPELLKQGAAFTNKKVTVDFDICDEDLVPSLKAFIDHGGDPDYLTLSTDASFASPETLLWEIRKAYFVLGWPLEKLLALVTTNTARILKLPHKGKIAEEADADLLILDSKNLELTHVIGNGKIFMKDREMIFEQSFLKESNRKIEIYGKKERQKNW